MTDQNKTYFAEDIVKLLQELVSEKQFREETLEGLKTIVEGQNTLNDAIGVLGIAIEMLCAKHGDDPVALMEAARDHIKREVEAND